MPKEKQAARTKMLREQALARRLNPKNKPNDACRQAVICVMVKFYESETTMSLDNKYIRYEEESVGKFKSDMWMRMMDELRASNWDTEMEKMGFNEWMESRTHDAIWNAPSILEKYGKEHRVDDESFQEVILKADLFKKRCQPFAKRRSRKGSVAWWESEEGKAQMQSNKQNLVALSDTARVIQQDQRVKRGGYATIRRVRIEGCPQIAPYWEFAAKMSLHHQTRRDLARMEHQNEVMAMRIPHPGVIRFVAVHCTKNEGYAYWWNGGTLREMFNMDKDYPSHIPDRVLHADLSPEDLVQSSYLARYRRKRTELAWALLCIMKEVHAAGHLHNDISPDNILLHFPEDESRLYIGVCDWGLASVFAEPKKSLYTFTSFEERRKVLEKRWWVDPDVAYLHKRDADIEIIPNYSRTSEEYAVGKIADRINNKHMSKDYLSLQREGPSMCKFSEKDFAQVFHTYLNRLCGKGEGNHSTLAHVVNVFMSKFNWPNPIQHFRTTY